MKAQYKEIEEKMNKTLDALYREFGTGPRRQGISIRFGPCDRRLLRRGDPYPAAGYHLHSRPQNPDDPAVG